MHNRQPLPSEELPGNRAAATQPTRVLHVIDSLGAGGKERQLLELLKGLEVQPAISSKLVVMSADAQYAESALTTCPAHILARGHRYDASIFLRLYRIARQFRPNIIHSWNSMCSVYSMPIAKLAGARFVDGYVRAAAPNLTWRDKDYLRGKLLMPFSDVVVANSAAGLNAYGVPPHKGICIHNGFDHGRLEGLLPTETVRRMLGIETQHVVGMVASFSNLKDYDTFFRSACAIARLRSDVTFLAVGNGDNFDRLRALLPPERYPTIRLLGHRQDVENLVNIFTVGVLTSNMKLHGEGIANAIMEYMAFGKPVVATDCGGNRELVEEGRSGYLIPSGDVAGLTAKILEFIDHPQLAAQFGEVGRLRIRAAFSLERMTQSYVRLYCGLMK